MVWLTADHAIHQMKTVNMDPGANYTNDSRQLYEYPIQLGSLQTSRIMNPQQDLRVVKHRLIGVVSTRK